MNSDDLILVNINLKNPLALELILTYNKLVSFVMELPESLHKSEIIIGFDKKIISVSNVLSYLLGWTNMVLTWYKQGKKGIIFIMPGEGFDTWNYEKITEYFYEKYRSVNRHKQCLLLKESTYKIIKIIETESQLDNLDKLGVWEWCTLKSGKKWPLKKWITVNSLSPYKRALSKIKTSIKNQ